MKFQKIPFGQLSIEFLSVVFAVLLALGLNSYKQSLDTRSEAKLIKESILLECRTNYAKIDSTLSANQAFYDYIDSLVQLGPGEVNNVSFNYSFELLNASAWSIALNNNAVNYLDQESLLFAAEIYHTQEFYTDFTSSFYQNLTEHITRMDEVPPYNTALSFYYSLNVMNPSANELQSKYLDFLEKYDTK
ncbi:hypothetical protein [Marinoscillum sp.]|uniref:hypothetical protein n=1 Tax=Marinoscillum sp. TaxID=2024838 RepID=UPI003BAAE1D6